MGVMSVLGNVLWVIFGGLELALGYFFGGFIMCCTIIGIPFGYQIFKIGVYALLPFGATTHYTGRANGCLATIMNIIWVILFGIILAFCHLVVGLVLCVTIIGIPFGLQHFKLIKLAIAPFGADIIRKY